MVHHCIHILTLQAESHRNRETYQTVIINLSQRSISAAIEQGVGHEIQVPAPTTAGEYGSLKAMGRGVPPTGPLPAKIQSLFYVDAKNFFVTDQPTFPTKQGLNSQTAVTYTCLGYLANARAQNRVIGSSGMTVKCRALDSYATGCPATAHTIGLDQEFCQLVTTSWLHSFLRTTSWSISLSS